jgi:hypothetical protein
MLDFSLIDHTDLLLFSAFTGVIIAGVFAAIARSRAKKRRPRDPLSTRKRR